MENIYREFDEKKYLGILKSYYYLEKKYQFYNSLIKEYQKFINDNIKVIISNAFEKALNDLKIDLVIF